MYSEKGIAMWIFYVASNTNLNKIKMDWGDHFDVTPPSVHTEG